MRTSSIYIHVPFCKQRCTYCSFKSVKYDLKMASNYVTAITKEIRNRKDEINGTFVTSLYIGGGTPSVFSGGQLTRIINELKKFATIDENTEFTVEVNPESVTPEKMYVYKVMGVNRISIGMQSSNNNVLRLANRPHTNDQFLQAIKAIKSAGIKNISIDCLIGLQGASKKEALKSVKQAIRQKPKHISAYALNCDENCIMYSLVKNNKIKLMTDDEVADVLEAVNKLLKSRGYIHYEISNYAKRGYYSKHNLNYWAGGDYVGFGCGAVTCKDNKRIECISEVSEYCLGKVKYKEEIITDKIRTEEKIMLGLRTNQGCDLDLINKDNLDYVKMLVERKFAVIKNNKLILTERGFNMSNWIISTVM